MLNVYETAQQSQTPLQAVEVAYMRLRHMQTAQSPSTLFSFKEKCLLWNPTLGPSLPSKLCVLTTRLTHTVQKLGFQVKVNQRG